MINGKDIVLLLETANDYAEVENLTREAFWNVHVPGCSEHYLVHIMRNSSAFLPELDFVAIMDGKIVGNIVYTRSTIQTKDCKEEVLCFGPISVLPKIALRNLYPLEQSQFR